MSTIFFIPNVEKNCFYIDIHQADLPIYTSANNSVQSRIAIRISECQRAMARGGSHAVSGVGH